MSSQRKFTFAISSPDEFLVYSSVCTVRSGITRSTQQSIIAVVICKDHPSSQWERPIFGVCHSAVSPENYWGDKDKIWHK